ncbi:MAG TPA: amidohydrolase family protein [Polyangiaceae bacterium]|jgi:cytosine/adenosine deaminase-related metal-dependent hydrolase|nr:amidohydrolase family protein [Polyangiaceae bacterium]
MLAPRAFHADAVVTGDAGVLRDGAVVVDGAGLVVDVGPAGELLPRHAGVAVERAHGVVLPGLVNAHTHIELSALRGHVPGGAGFVPWVEQMIGVRAEIAPEDDAAAIDRAVADLDAFGTAAVGEVSNSLSAVRPLARRGIVGRVFHEVFGIERASLEQRVAGLPAILADRVGDWPSADLEYAPSPHTLYTTHPDVVRRLVREARERGARASLHLAEHAAERRFLEHGDGPIPGWYEARLRVRRDLLEWPGKSPVALADDLGALGPHVLCVHLTDARPEELELVARRGAPVVFCPRSNLFIETRLPPLLSALAAGVVPALGTDSLASNASLDVLAEAKALADRFPSVPAADLLRMATWEGARALGRDDVGRITRGARPGLVAIEADASALGDDPCAFVLRNLRLPRRWLVRRGPASPPSPSGDPS